VPLLPIKWGEQPNNPPPTSNDTWSYPYVRMSCASIDVKATAEGRYGEYFGKAETSASHHVVEFAMLHPVASQNASGDTHLYGRWFIATLASSRATANFSAAIAAATATGSGSAQTNHFRALTLGIDDAALGKLRSVPTRLDADSVQTLGAGFSQALEWCLGENDTVEPAGVYEVRTPTYHAGHSGLFALNRIKRGSSFDDARRFLDDALSSSGKRKEHAAIDILTVRAMYHRFGLDEETAPSQAQQKRAKEILNNSGALPAANNTRRGFWYELPPFTSGDGTAPGLDRLTQLKKRIAVNPWPPAPGDVSGPATEISGYAIDVEAALRMGVSALLDLASNVDARFQGYGFTSRYVRKGVQDSVILNERYSAGFRVRIRTTGSETGLGVPAIAARGTIGATEVSYEIEGLGIDAKALTGLPSFVGASIGKFDVTTLNSLGLLYEEASAVLTKKGTEWKPILTAVEIDVGAPEVQGLTDAVKRSLELAVAPEASAREGVAVLEGGRSPELAAILALGD
jgi:hypothetical protein